MIIKRFSKYLENFVDPVKVDLKKFDGSVRHKIFNSSSGEVFNVWISKDVDASLKLTRLYVGKHALDLGGHAPSTNDVWLGKEEYVAVVKTNKDDIVPKDVLIDVAFELRRLANTHKEDLDEVEMSKSSFVSVRNGEVLIDRKNSGRVIFSPGNVRFEL